MNKQGGLLMETLGLFILLIGVALLTYGILGFGMAGVIIGIAFMVAGRSAAKGWRCEYCGNPIADKKVKICPVCEGAPRAP